MNASSQPPEKRPFSVVAIGTSHGGVHAVERLLRTLGPNFPLPIVIVQHVPAKPIDFSLLYRSSSHSTVCEAEDKQRLEAGRVYMAPPDYHLLVEDEGTLSLSGEERVNWARPSVDVLFESVAHAFGPRAIGVLLTGANHDGAVGLALISKKKGYTLVQDPVDATNPSMPQAALALFSPDDVLPLVGIGQRLRQLVGLERLIGLAAHTHEAVPPTREDHEWKR
jgi:two-component system, chemotaxis family, protein-glutamate methylesterase/glutaminase